MRSFRATTTIRATPEKIWKLLTDAAGYASWNTTVDKVEGRIAYGEKVTVYPKGASGRAFPAKVTQFEPNASMTWSGSTPLGLFKGARTFTLTPRTDGTVEFTMAEVFSGLLEPLIGKKLPDLQPAFEEWAEALKKKSESGPS